MNAVIISTKKAKSPLLFRLAEGILVLPEISGVRKMEKGLPSSGA
jgi:hypothetical protein